MNRISLEQSLNRVKSRLLKLEPVKNILFDYYLDGFKRREEKEEKVSIVFINCIIIFSYILCIVKYLAGFGKLSYTTKLILFDMSSLFGGIELYNRILILLCLIAGLADHSTLRWTTSGRHREWTRIFELARGQIAPDLGIASHQSEMQTKLIKAMKVIFRVVTVLWIVLSKTILVRHS